MLRSVVLITVDCLRADHTGFMGYRVPTTPFLDSLAAESLVFENAIVGGVPTYFSLPALLASRHPLNYGREVVGLTAGEDTLASVMRDAGYATAAFTAANPYLTSRFGYDAGFDTFEDFLHEDSATWNAGQGVSNRSGIVSRLNQATGRFCHRVPPLGKIYDEIYFQYCQHLAAPTLTFDELRRFPAADELVERAKEWLSSTGDQPFFLWLHFMDPHGPYYPKEEALRAIGDTEMTAQRARYLNGLWNRSLGARRHRRIREEIVSLYDAGIRWVDTQVGRLVDTLRQTRRWDDCVFVFTADHGEEFLEHGGRFHPPWTMKEELIHVPLMVRSVSGKPGRQASTISHLDLAPTMLSAIGISAPAGMRGNDRLQSVQGEPWDKSVIVDCTRCSNPNVAATRQAPRVLCVRERGFKLVLGMGEQSEEMFDLNADPDESHPIPVGTEDGMRRRLLQDARQHLIELESSDSRLRLQAGVRELCAQIEAGARSGGTMNAPPAVAGRN